MDEKLSPRHKAGGGNSKARSKAKLLNYRVVLLAAIVSALVLAISSDHVTRVGAPRPDEPSVIFMAVGDVLLDRGVARRIERHGMVWPFEEVGATLRQADIAFCNLECPLSLKGIKISKPIAFKADPAHAQCLDDAGFDIVSLANNHALDCGRSGLVETMECLEREGIAHTGAGMTLADSSQPTILEVNGLKVAFLARSMLFPEGVWYRPDAPGIALLETSTIEREIADARGKADIVIVSLHWGIEYRKHPEPGQKDLARKLIDAGADLILGHHPHVLQPVEKYHGGVIAYSLGNFLFDSPFEKCKQSAIFRCRLSKAGVFGVEFIPIRIADCRPIMEVE